MNKEILQPLHLIFRKEWKKYFVVYCQWILFETCEMIILFRTAPWCEVFILRQTFLNAVKSDVCDAMQKGLYGLDNQISFPRVACTAWDTKMKNYWAHPAAAVASDAHLAPAFVFLLFERTARRQHNIRFHLFRKVNINSPSSGVHLFSGKGTRSACTPNKSLLFPHIYQPKLKRINTVWMSICTNWFQPRLFKASFNLFQFDQNARTSHE